MAAPECLFGGKTVNVPNFQISKERFPMSTTDPITSAAPASTATTAPAATTTKKPASLKAVTGFSKLDPNVLVNTAHLVAKGVGGNPVYFPNPPIRSGLAGCVGEHTVGSGPRRDGW